MQINGLGNEHNSSSHYVTVHVHKHGEMNKDMRGGMQNSAQTAVQQVKKTSTQQAPMTEVGLLQRLLDKGKNLLKAIWGSSDGTAEGSMLNADGKGIVDSGVLNTNSNGAGAGNAGYEAAAHNQSMVHTEQQSVAEAAVQSTAKTGVTGGNPYFTVAEESQKPKGFFGEIRIKIKGIAGQLAGKLPGNMFRSMTNNSFEAGTKKQSQEDMKRRSKYKKDQVEIDCIITDDSFLMDSYDRKGGYRKLTTKE